MALVNRPVNRQHPLTVRRLVLLGRDATGLHHSIEDRPVFEDGALRQLFPGGQDILPHGEQVRHLERLGVREGRGGGAERHDRNLGLGVHGLSLGRRLPLLPHGFHTVFFPLNCHY